MAKARKDLSSLTEQALLDLFVKYAIEQDDALLGFEVARSNRMYWAIKDVTEELKSRPGDRRRALIPFYRYGNPQVRFKAAEATLALEPAAARAVLESLRSIHGPQQLDAGMAISGLDDGSYKPT